MHKNFHIKSMVSKAYKSLCQLQQCTDSWPALVIATMKCYFAFITYFILASTSAHNVDTSNQHFQVSAQTSGGTCAGAGHTSGCCQGSSSSCSVISGSNICYCDENCHMTGECCSDILAIGCSATSCRSAGLHPGCCSWLSNNCRANGGCYCDRACSWFNDCCSDVPRGMQCSPLPDIMNQVQYEGREPSQYNTDLKMGDRELMREQFIASRMRGRAMRRRPMFVNQQQHQQHQN